EWRLREPGHGGLHHAPARSQSAGPDAVRAAAAGGRGPGSSECVRLLIDVGANLEAHDCHFGTPLHVACAREHLDCVKVLLNAGANVNAAKLHETALHHAAKVKNVDLIEMLIEFGGNIYARDNRGKKPADYTWNSSAPAKCFEYYEKTPLTLSQLCRAVAEAAATQAAPPGVPSIGLARFCLSTCSSGCLGHIHHGSGVVPALRAG
ncbi:ankyrin repeat and SOCS box protein 13, partial [Carlito syrichta]|uniref:Ankyrin repeat and SOCS box protein 13 n=1 Tax=Carlito syrichta TaxID=1868482 RepID=A0A3Q0DTP5_CARSF